METPRRACALLLAALAAAGAGGAAGDDADLDAEIRARIDRAWEEIRDYWAGLQPGSEEEENPQPRLAGELYAYWVEHPGLEAAQRAMESAFMMWGNIGAVEEIEEALERLDPDSESWGRILNSVNNAYATSERGDDFRTLCEKLEGELTDPKSRSELMSYLARFHVRDDPGRARRYYEKMIELAADPFYVNRARGEIYELDSLNPGQAAPGFRAKDIDGAQVALSSLAGRIVLLEFWATWCGPCLPEIDRLKSIRKKHSEDEVVVIGISLDREVEALREFVEKEELTWPQLLQKDGWEGEISKLYNVAGIPRSFLIDAEGTLVEKDLRGEDLEAAIDRLAGASRAP